jgi:hypothetical protein
MSESEDRLELLPKDGARLSVPEVEEAAKELAHFILGRILPASRLVPFLAVAMVGGFACRHKRSDSQRFRRVTGVGESILNKGDPEESICGPSGTMMYALPLHEGCPRDHSLYLLDFCELGDKPVNFPYSTVSFHSFSEGDARECPEAGTTNLPGWSVYDSTQANGASLNVSRLSSHRFHPPLKSPEEWSCFREGLILSVELVLTETIQG